MRCNWDQGEANTSVMHVNQRLPRILWTDVPPMNTVLKGRDAELATALSEIDGVTGIDAKGYALAVTRSPAVEGWDEIREAVDAAMRAWAAPEMAGV